MNSENQHAASELLEMLGLPSPHSEEDCQKIINFMDEWREQNKIPSFASVILRAERGTLGFFAGLQEVVNELKASRMSRS